MRLRKLRRIVVELYALQNIHVGVGEFAFNLARGLAARAPMLREKYGIQFFFIVPKNYDGEFGGEVNYIVANKQTCKLLTLLPGPYGLFHATHQYSRVKNIFSARVNLMTIHDINFMYEKAGSRLDKYKSKFRSKLRRASALSYISNFVYNDVRSVFGPKHRYRIIYNGSSNLTRTAAEAGRMDGIEDGFLFHISSLQPKKNTHLLIEMMAHMPQERLVITGDWNSDYCRDMKKRIEELELDNITALDNVSLEQKASLLAGCKALLFPSLCEGFGLPPVEAMHFGKPVFLSQLTSLPEVGGSEACYWDDLEPEKMADRVRKGLLDYAGDKDKPARIREWAAQYTWDKCVDGYVGWYLELLKIKV